jgi:hypothetical protein
MMDSSLDAKAWCFYTTKYQTKVEQNTAIVNSIGTASFREEKKEATRIATGTYHPEDVIDAERNRSFLMSMLYTLRTKSEVYTPELVRQLCKLPEFYNSHEQSRSLIYKDLMFSIRSWSHVTAPNLEENEVIS